MPKTIRIRKGLNIHLKGRAEKVSFTVPSDGLYAVFPDDFPAVAPKLEVSQGDRVLAGDVLFRFKKSENVCFTSPVSGIVEEIRRGERRKVEMILIRADVEQSYRGFSLPENPSSGQIRELMQQSGLWAFFRTRPFDTVPMQDAVPRDIFVSTFHTAPLAPDTQFTLAGRMKEFQAGIDALAALTPGKVWMGMDGAVCDSVFDTVTGVEKILITGPHPAGNASVLINHTLPVNKGETVFTMSPEDVATVGSFMLTGKYSPIRKIAVTGSGVEKPRYVSALQGASIEKLTDGNIRGEEKMRFISGNVLTGRDAGRDGFIGFYDNQVTVIPEGDRDTRMFGWISPSSDRFSFLRAGTFSWLFPSREYELNTSTNGEPRHFVLTGIYGRVFPFDIFPEELVKAAITGDVERMEALGIYEIAPEDFALCSFVCPSKIEHQVIIRRALDKICKEDAGY